MINKHDVTGDGMLNFNEFKAIFFNNKELEEDGFETCFEETADGSASGAAQHQVKESV